MRWQPVVLALLIPLTLAGCATEVSKAPQSLLIPLLDVDPKGGSLSTHKIKYFVTSPKFVNINGIPYLEAAATESLIG